MTSSPLISPLTFARDYAQYRSRSGRIPFADTRLLAASRFWRDRHTSLGDPSFESFWREDLPPLLQPCDLDDLFPDEIEEIANFVDSLPTALRSSLSTPTLWELSAKKWFYVGEIDRALSALNHARVNESPSLGTVSTDVTAEHIPTHLLEQCAPDLGPILRGWLERFNAEWHAQREGGSSNQAFCVLVEHDEAIRPVRGRLRLLQAQVETLDGKSGADQVVFGHQLRAADDPQVSGAYAALAALRSMSQRSFVGAVREPPESDPSGRHQRNSPRLRGNFQFLGGGRELYGGDSIAFAAFATAYCDWWSKDLHRERHLISGNVALTGALDENGQAVPVSDSSLEKKVERVYYSPLSHIAVPEANRAVAEKEAERLRQLHPRKRLRVIGIERISDIATDGNITIPERVCLGEYAVRAAAQYTRSVKVQIPVLVVLAYLLLCLVYPKAWVGFDWNPSNIRFETTGLRAVNSNGQSLWAWDFPCEFVDTLSPWTLDDLDGDGKSELAFLLNTPRSTPCSANVSLYLIDHDGKVTSNHSAAILREYPGDTSLNIPYLAPGLIVLDCGDKKRIMTVLTDSYPARSHVSFWTPTGLRTGWYITAGFLARIDQQHLLLDHPQRVCLIGYNNRMSGAASLVVLPVDSAIGCSPPYSDSIYDISWVRRGNQLRYVIFPRSDLSIAYARAYSTPEELRSDPGGFLTVTVDEGDDKVGHVNIWYTLDDHFRVSRVRVDDYFWPSRDQLVTAGLLHRVDRQAYLDSLRNKVLYWTDSGWVSEGQLRALISQR